MGTLVLSSSLGWLWLLWTRKHFGSQWNTSVDCSLAKPLWTNLLLSRHSYYSKHSCVCVWVTITVISYVFHRTQKFRAERNVITQIPFTKTIDGHFETMRRLQQKLVCCRLLRGLNGTLFKCASWACETLGGVCIVLPWMAKRNLALGLSSWNKFSSSYLFLVLIYSHLSSSLEEVVLKGGAVSQSSFCFCCQLGSWQTTNM